MSSMIAFALVLVRRLQRRSLKMLIYPRGTVAMTCRYRSGMEIDEPSAITGTLRYGAQSSVSEPSTHFSSSLELTLLSFFFRSIPPVFLPSIATVGSSVMAWGGLNRQQSGMTTANHV